MPSTSQQARDRHRRSGRTAAQMETVLAAVRAAPGSTAGEIHIAAGLDRHAVSRRLPELERLGLVRRDTARACRVLHSSCLTWWPVGNVQGRLF